MEIQTGVVELGEGSGEALGDELGESMPSFEMLIQTDPYQSGSGPLLGATVYRAFTEEISDELEKKNKDEKDVLLSSFFSK